MEAILLVETSPIAITFTFLQAETTVINQCTKLLSPSADPSYVMTYISHSFPQHRQYLCAGAWILMHGHPENINNANLVCYSNPVFHLIFFYAYQLVLGP